MFFLVGATSQALRVGGRAPRAVGKMATRDMSCLPFLGNDRGAAAERKGPSLVERVRTLAASPGLLPARPTGLVPGQQMPHITLHTVQVTCGAAQSNVSVGMSTW